MPPCDTGLEIGRPHRDGAALDDIPAVVDWRSTSNTQFSQTYDRRLLWCDIIMDILLALLSILIKGTQMMDARF